MGCMVGMVALLGTWLTWRGTWRSLWWGCGDNRDTSDSRGGERVVGMVETKPQRGHRGNTGDGHGRDKFWG